MTAPGTRQISALGRGSPIQHDRSSRLEQRAPRGFDPGGLLALALAVAGGVLLGWGLKDAAPFIFFSTEEEVAVREQGEQMMLVGTAILAAAAVMLIVIGRRMHALLVAASGIATTGLLFSPVGGSVAPHVAFLLVVPAAAAALWEASGMTSPLRSQATAASVSPAEGVALGLLMLATLYAFVYATGPIGAAGTIVAPFVFWFSLRSLR